MTLVLFFKGVASKYEKSMISRQANKVREEKKLMKQFLKKRWHGIPVGIVSALLAIVLVAGGVLAATGAFEVFRSDTEVTVLEPLEVTEIQATGEWWDWSDPEATIQHPEIYAGMDIGAIGYGGKYFIENLIPSHNLYGLPSGSPQFISVTVTVEETTGQMEWYGIDIYPANGWHATDTANWDLPFVTSTAEDNVQTFTFDMGSITYPSPCPGGDILADSNQIKFFVQGKVAGNAELATPLNFIVTVERGG